MVKRILVSLSSTDTSASGSSTSFCISPTVFRGTITPAIVSAPAGRVELRLGEAVAVGRHRAEHRLFRRP